MWRAPVTIVLNLLECRPNNPQAELDPAIRDLLERNFCVVVDSAENSLPKQDLAMLRHIPLHVPPMSRECLQCLPQLQRMLQALREAGEAELAWAVIGGMPCLYAQLDRRWELSGGGDIRLVVKMFLQTVLNSANDDRRETAIDDKRLAKIYLQLRKVDSLPKEVLDNEAINLPAPHKVLRVIQLADGTERIVPATSAMLWVLKLGPESGPPPSLDKVCASLASETSSSPCIGELEHA